MRLAVLIRIALAAIVAMAASSCSHVDNRRLPPADVNIVFWTEADWVTYGISGAGMHKEFIRQDKIPANFPFTAQTFTGYGGTLLCTTYAGVPVAYDLACPVECNHTIRVAVNSDGYAECPRCHSLYDVFSLQGHPIAGPAAERGYGLELRYVGPGNMGEYMVVRRIF